LPVDISAGAPGTTPWGLSAKGWTVETFWVGESVMVAERLWQRDEWAGLKGPLNGSDSSLTLMESGEVSVGITGGAEFKMEAVTEMFS